MSFFKRNLLVSMALISADFLGLTLSLYLANYLFNFEVNSTHLKSVSLWQGVHEFIAICCIAWYGMRLRHYIYRKTFWFELKEILRTLVIFAIFELAILAFGQWQVSRTSWLLCWLFVALLVPGLRMLTKELLKRKQLWQRDTIIIGTGANALEAYKAINNETNLGFKVIRFIGSGSCGISIDEITGIPLLEQSANELEKSIDKRIQFIIALENHESEILNQWLRSFMLKGYRYVSVVPTLRGMPLDSTDMSFIFSHEVMLFRVQQSLAKWPSRLFKRAFDICTSLVMIILLSPLLLYIRSQVRQDGGPAIYGHERIGKHGVPFKCLKFRSMAVNSKQLLAELLATDQAAKAEWEASFKLKHDPRVTKIGAFLRRSSLDELPQLFNVLKGEMSLVGPRPIIQQELERYRDQVDYYLMSKPGMTGLWQVSGRSDVDYETRVYFDAWYVKNWSMWNDIAILFKTVAVVFKRDGAY